MSEKRYALVRVDNFHKCPEQYENINNDFVCETKDRFCRMYADCSNCRYGDTKEQLVRKVTQALVRARIEEIKNSKSLSWEQIATRIVEFLGVEE